MKYSDILSHKARSQLITCFEQYSLQCNNEDEMLNQFFAESGEYMRGPIFHIAAKLDATEVMQLFFDNIEPLGLSVNFWRSATASDSNAAHLSVEHGANSVLKFFIDNKVELGLAEQFWQAVDLNGYTVIDYALIYKNNIALDMLFKRRKLLGYGHNFWTQKTPMLFVHHVTDVGNFPDMIYDLYNSGKACLSTAIEYKKMLKSATNMYDSVVENENLWFPGVVKLINQYKFGDAFANKALDIQFEVAGYSNTYKLLKYVNSALDDRFNFLLTADSYIELQSIAVKYGIDKTLALEKLARAIMLKTGPSAVKKIDKKFEAKRKELGVDFKASRKCLEKIESINLKVNPTQMYNLAIHSARIRIAHVRYVNIFVKVIRAIVFPTFEHAYDAINMLIQSHAFYRENYEITHSAILLDALYSIYNGDYLGIFYSEILVLVSTRVYETFPALASAMAILVCVGAAVSLIVDIVKLGNELSTAYYEEEILHVAEEHQSHCKLSGDYSLEMLGQCHEI